MNPQNPQINSHETIIGPNLKVTRDKKSGARVINFPFEFPSTGERGVIIVCKIDDDEWVPAQDIKSIVINFK